MEGVAGEKEPLREFGRPAGADEFQVAARRGAVDLVADNGKSAVGKMNPDLMGSAGEGLCRDQREPAYFSHDSRQDLEAGVGSRPCGMDGALEVDC